MRINGNYVLIRPEEDLFDNVELGTTGIRIKVDRSFETGLHATTSGIVEEVPSSLFFSKELKYSRVSLRFGTVMELEKGDRVVFHHNAVKTAMAEGFFISDKKDPLFGCVFIKYDGLFVRIRKGEVYPLNGIVLVEPVEEKIKSDVELINDDYKQHDKQAIIIPQSYDPKNRKKSIVRYVGTPLTGYNSYFDYDGDDSGCDIKPGDTIYHTTHDCIPIQYSIHQSFDKGKTLWRMRMFDVLCKEEVEA